MSDRSSPQHVFLAVSQPTQLLSNIQFVTIRSEQLTFYGWLQKISELFCLSRQTHLAQNRSHKYIHKYFPVGLNIASTWITMIYWLEHIYVCYASKCWSKINEIFQKWYGLTSKILLRFQTVSPLRLDMPPNKDAAADLIWSLPNAQCLWLHYN